MTGLRRLRSVARADFRRSVGVYVTPDRVHVVRMRRSLTRFALLRVESVELDRKPESGLQGSSLAEAIQALLPSFGPANTPVYVCFAPEFAIECQVSLPQVARDNLEQVLEYEFERLIPFRRDEIYYDFVSGGVTGDKISVSLFAVPKTALDPVLDTLTSFGFGPVGVETAATSLLNYLLFCNGREPGVDVIVAAQGGALVLDGLRSTSRGWSANSEILYTQRMPDSPWSRGLGKEVLRGLIDESPRFYNWGQVGEILFDDDDSMVAPRDLLELGRNRILMPATVTDESLPAIGACLRGLRESALPVNLLPGSRESVKTKTLSGFNAFLGVLLLVGLVAWGGSYAVKDELRLRQLEAELAQIQPAVRSLQNKEEELNRLTAQFVMLSELGATRGEVIKILDELSRTVPVDAYLSSMRYRDGTVELRGSAVNSSNLVPLLEASGLFEEVGFNAPSTRRGGDNRETFSLTAKIEGRVQPGDS